MLGEDRILPGGKRGDVRDSDIAERLSSGSREMDAAGVGEAADDLVSAASGRLVLAGGLFRRFARNVASARPAIEERLLEEFLGQADLELDALEKALEAARLRPADGRAGTALA